MKIVLAIDGSEHSNIAIEKLTQLTFATNSEIRIVSVYENPLLFAPGAVPMGGLPDNYEQAMLSVKKSSENTIKEAAKLLKEKNAKLNITTTVLHGQPKNAILNEAETFGADLIVVGSQGHGAFSRFLLGSVSQFLAMHANCSVMIVRKKGEK